ncbi:MAG: choice-of-anchor B family protein, partial [Candidatus Promineifilaceae bacterium]
ALAAARAGQAAQGPEPGPSRPLTRTMQALLADKQQVEPLSPMGLTLCSGGDAGEYPCDKIDLMSFLPLADIGGGSGNDSWGWTDPLDGKEYALMGRSSGTSFVDISDPVNPIYLGNLPTHTSNSTWRDIKVYADHAFVVSEAGGHGLQVFDLTELRNVPAPPATFSESAHYPGFGNAHNLAINEESGFAYAVGSDTCSGGLHMVNIQDPLNPAGAGCFSEDGYSHDTQCVIYAGPDAEHQGQEICFNSNEDTLTIADVTDKANPVKLARTPYDGAAYTHQGWLTPDQVYFLLDDELDELDFGHNTRTRVWDVSDLDAPALIGFFDGPAESIDHNQYVHEGYSYQANYRSGLRVLDLVDVAAGELSQAGYFDIYPFNDAPSFNGAWSTYPYYASGVVIISGIEQGLFVVRPRIPEISLGQPAGEPAPDNLLNYTVQVTNTTIVTATEVTVILELEGSNLPLPGPAELGPGESASYSYTYGVTPADCEDGQLTAAASVQSETVMTRHTAEPVVTPLAGCVSFELHLPSILRSPP